MTVLAVNRDPVALTLTIVSEFDAPVARVWQVWADPRQLERWWGPPTYSATVVDHDLTPGGRVTYYMTGPNGQKYHGWWRVIAVDAPNSLEIEDGFADDSGRPVELGGLESTAPLDHDSCHRWGAAAGFLETEASSANGPGAGEPAAAKARSPTLYPA